jgi:AcrR family transcriptional regulator
MTKKNLSEEIVKAALELAKTTSLTQVSQAKIAKQAGVTQSHLTYYFPKRSDLIKAALIKMQEELFNTDELLSRLGETSLTPHTLKRLILNEVGNTSRSWLIISALLASHEDEELQRWFEQFEESLYNNFTLIIEKAGLKPLPEEISVLHMCIVGCNMLSVHPNSGDRLVQVQSALDKLFDALITKAQLRKTPSNNI